MGFRSLRDVLKYFGLSGYSVHRNDVLALIVSLMMLFPKMDIVACGLAKGKDYINNTTD